MGPVPLPLSAGVRAGLRRARGRHVHDENQPRRRRRPAMAAQGVPLHPTPWTLNPKPWTLNPKPQTLDSISLINIGFISWGPMAPLVKLPVSW